MSSNRVGAIALVGFLLVLAVGFGIAGAIHAARGDRGDALIAGGMAVLLVTVGTAASVGLRRPAPGLQRETTHSQPADISALGLMMRGGLAGGAAYLGQRRLWPIGLTLGLALALLGIAEGRGWRGAARFLVTGDEVAQGREAAATVFLGFVLGLAARCTGSVRRSGVYPGRVALRRGAKSPWQSVSPPSRQPRQALRTTLWQLRARASSTPLHRSFQAAELTGPSRVSVYWQTRASACIPSSSTPLSARFRVVPLQ